MYNPTVYLLGEIDGVCLRVKGNLMRIRYCFVHASAKNIVSDSMYIDVGACKSTLLLVM